MPKQKTHKASSKVFKKRPSGTITYKKSGGNHKTGKDSGKAVRQRRNLGKLAKGEVDRIKSVI
ncbi:MAG: 50S ribosomal protein L35 [Mollicutes bacterium]|jgi:ribosomal protein L35|nr:50S ribosomal protein L35 [Mollicutes bacterium]